MIKGILCTIIWCIIAYLLDVGVAGAILLCVFALGTFLVAYLLGLADGGAEADIVVDHSKEAADKAALALLRMSTMHSMCPYCHGHLGRHSDKCLLWQAQTALVKVK